MSAYPVEVTPERREAIERVRAQYRLAALKDITGFGYFDPERALRNADRPVSEIVAEAIEEFSRRGGDPSGVTP